jgi:methionine biosynthesis protein MetW
MTTRDILRADLQLIASLVPDGSRVLDLGSGDGSLMAHLRDEKNCTVRGVELSHEGIAASVERGLSVVQADLDGGLSAYADGSFDVVVLSQTLQVVRRPDLVMKDMARVGSTCIVSFPNFAYWKIRGFLLFRGRMPVSRSIPYQWYETPNIHHTTVRDFRVLCDHLGLEIVREIPLSTDDFGHASPVGLWPNLRADTALAVVRRAGGR